MTMETFPFGAPVLPCGVEAPDRRFDVVVLGAYPSALHVRWSPPPGFGRPVAALPVDNEPTPFWDGDRVEELFETWRQGYFDPRWGQVAPARLNGPSGHDLEKRWLSPCGYHRDQALITDCLDTARASTGVARRLTDRYHPFAEAVGAPRAILGRHPSENEIVNEAVNHHAARLLAQITAAAPELIITLGNAAARVVARLGRERDRDGRLQVDSYGQARTIALDGHTYQWQALVHPATPREWAARHSLWLQNRS
jgi:uracil-DNA glycosylase